MNVEPEIGDGDGGGESTNMELEEEAVVASTVPPVANSPQDGDGSDTTPSSSPEAGRDDDSALFTSVEMPDLKRETVLADETITWSAPG